MWYNGISSHNLETFNVLNYSETVMPICLAVPSIILAAASTVYAFKSGIFVFAISSNCALVIVATLSFLAFLAPDGIFAAFLSKSEAGGVFVTIENVLSS